MIPYPTSVGLSSIWLKTPIVQILGPGYSLASSQKTRGHSAFSIARAQLLWVSNVKLTQHTHDVRLMVYLLWVSPWSQRNPKNTKPREILTSVTLVLQNPASQRRWWEETHQHPKFQRQDWSAATHRDKTELRTDWWPLFPVFVIYWRWDGRQFCRCLTRSLLRLMALWVKHTSETSLFFN